MVDPVKFYFDFSSPYSYFAMLKIERTCNAVGREVVWKPFLLGVLFKITDTQPANHPENKQVYRENDWHRMARFMDVSWNLPDPFPIPTQAPARAFYWIHDTNPKLAKDFARHVFEAYFSSSEDISSPDIVLKIATRLGIDRAQLADALIGEDIKQRLKDETQSAIESGVCGSPYFVVDGQGFWGSDRIWMVRKWIERGGW